MRAHGNTVVDQTAHGIGKPRAAFEFNHVRACLHEFDRIVQRILGRAIRAKRHIRHHPRARSWARVQATQNRFGVIHHVAHLYRNRGALPLNHIAQRITDEDAIHVLGIQ